MTSPHAATSTATQAPSEPLVCPVKAWHRWIYLGLGWGFVALGMAGAVLPVLPTTPFLLLALWAFSRSSQRLHDWLYHHPRFGAPLRAWRDHRVIPLRAKIASVSAMSASMAYVSFFTPSPLWAKACMAACLLATGWWITTRPSRLPSSAQHDQGRDQA
jgi:uncharacterized membrane protein YbaN (DUF454 family)